MSKHIYLVIGAMYLAMFLVRENGDGFDLGLALAYFWAWRHHRTR